jgi:hypothetical protein
MPRLAAAFDLREGRPDTLRDRAQVLDWIRQGVKPKVPIRHIFGEVQHAIIHIIVIFQ